MAGVESANLPTLSETLAKHLDISVSISGNGVNHASEENRLRMTVNLFGCKSTFCCVVKSKSIF